MNEKISRTLSFYALTTTLKDTIRTGWINWHISKDRIESVAEHIYGTCMLAIAIDSEFTYDIDLSKVIKMLAIHELEEIVIGDITPFDGITASDKHAMGIAAVKKILGDLVKKDEYYNLIEEFNKHETSESKYAYNCDKLEAILQAKLYEQSGYSNIHSDLNKEMLSHPDIKAMLDRGANNLTDLFTIHNGKNLDELFYQIADYTKKNDIK